MAKKSAIRKVNKKFIKVVVIIGVLALLLSSALAYFGRMPNPGPDPSTLTDAAIITDTELQITQLEDSLETAPDNVYLLTQLGNKYYQLGWLYNSALNEEKSKESFTKALEPYEKVLEVEPENVDVRVDRAVCAFGAINYEVAEEEFDKALEIDPKHAKAYYNYGAFLYVGLNDAVGALEKWNTLLDKNLTDDTDLIAATRGWIATVEAEMFDDLKGDPSEFEDLEEAGDTTE